MYHFFIDFEKRKKNKTLTVYGMQPNETPCGTRKRDLCAAKNMNYKDLTLHFLFPFFFILYYFFLIFFLFQEDNEKEKYS